MQLHLWYYRYGDYSGEKKEIPGPGSYSPFPDFGKESKKLSFGGRTKSLYGMLYYQRDLPIKF